MPSLTNPCFTTYLLLAVITVSACNGVPVTSGAQEPKSETDQVFYALGTEFGRRITSLRMSPAELEMVKTGLSDAVSEKASKVDLEKIRPVSAELTGKRKKLSSDLEKKKGAAFLDNMAREPGARRLPSGLVIKTLRPGTGTNPGATDIVQVNFEGRLLDGTVFESSAKENKPLEVGLLAVMSCWQLGIPAMKVGEKAQIVCPSELAYGDEGVPPVLPGGAALAFDIELLNAKPLNPAPDVSRPRPDPPEAL